MGIREHGDTARREYGIAFWPQIGAFNQMTIVERRSRGALPRRYHSRSAEASGGQDIFL
jgi:hypothetical protein